MTNASLTEESTSRTIEVGGRPLRLAGIVVEEPDRPLNGVELGPRVILPLSEVEAGGLLGPGARASWRIAVAGSRRAARQAGYSAAAALSTSRSSTGMATPAGTNTGWMTPVSPGMLSMPLA